MSLASLEAFLRRVHDDPGLRGLLVEAPDAASVAAIARAAGFPVSELDLWQATGASPDDLAPAAEAVQPAAEAVQPAVEAVRPAAELSRPASGAPPFTSGREADTAIDTATGLNPAEAPASGGGQWVQEEQAEPPAANANATTNPRATAKATGTDMDSGTANQKAKAPAGMLPDPWWEGEPLTRFVHQAQGDSELRQALATASDAAAVASIAQAAGYPISEVDLWLASGTTPDELAASLRPHGQHGRSQEDTPMDVRLGEDASPGDGALGEEPASARQAGPAEAGLWMEVGPAEADAAPVEGGSFGADASPLEVGPPGVVGSWAGAGPTLAESPHAVERPRESDPLLAQDGPTDAQSPITGERFHDVERARAGPGPAADADSCSREEDPFAPDAPFSGTTSWPEETLSAADDALAASTDAFIPQAAAEVAIRRFLRRAEADAELRQALASAPDAAAVAAIAQAAGHPISELALWLASGAAFEEAQTEPEPPSPANDPLTLFLRAVEADPDLRIALASAPDAATVAAIARIAGFPLTAADLWAASDAVPQELELERWLVQELFVEELVVEERVILGR
ncbi:MAG: Nif11-like leader peptide family natural product precursor [Cyanobacteriota bacterium]|nr:Nif11-like leader peptide family natural product precursor [Cyanobacteriota bacterium]